MIYRTSLEAADAESALRGSAAASASCARSRPSSDVSFDVPHGKVLGVVGANGAGKSTLMRTIAGILPPTAGRVEVNGRVSTLLALGVGFNRS